MQNCFSLEIKLLFCLCYVFTKILHVSTSKSTTFSIYADFEQRKAFDGENRKCWSSGIFMTYIF